MPEAAALLSAIEQRIESAVGALTGSAGQAAAGDTPLLKLINSNVDFPGIKQADLSNFLDTLGLSRLVDGFDLDDLFGNIGSLIQRPSGQGRPSLNLGALKLPDTQILGRLKELADRLLTDGNPLTTIRSQIDSLRQDGHLSALPTVLHGIVGRQVALGISFITTLRNLVNPDLPPQIVKGWMDYFFADGGYKTLDGIQIVAPAQAGQGAASLTPAGLQQNLKGLLNERSAEQYVRDLIRILVEVGGNVRYNHMDGRLMVLDTKVPDAANKQKAVRWFKGAGSMAESMVTSAVEELALGVAQFQTNPVLAAAAATYAGTAARKASQHAFLSAAGIP